MESIVALTDIEMKKNYSRGTTLKGQAENNSVLGLN